MTSVEHDAGCAQVVFRDPPSCSDRAREIRLALARTLVGAPSLPVALPRLRSRLLDVRVEREGIALDLDGPGLRARIRLLERRSDGTSRPRVVVDSPGPTAPGLARALEIVAARVATAVTPERWRSARGLARDLARLPDQEPMSHFRQIVDGVEPHEGLVRTGFACNQDCVFC
jgi:hypothetical protein